MYFRLFPRLQYTLDNKASFQTIEDILRRVLIKNDYKINRSSYQLYDVADGETPEIVAHKFYNNTGYHWIILHANEIIDPRFDWLMSEYDLQMYCKEKYGEGNVYALHHYEWVINVDTDAEKRLVLTPEQKEFLGPEETINYTETISNYEYESRLNEEKRTIRIPVKELVEEIKKEFSRIIKE
jgi:hypothetical protein